MARKVKALEEIILALDGSTQPDMGVADCIHEIAYLVANFVSLATTAITSFDARLKALEGNG